MTKHLISLAAALALSSHIAAQEESETPPPSPNEIVAEASADEWIAVAPEDLIVMTLAPDAEGNSREVIIQLMPPPFSEKWTANIRTFARSGWFDDITVNRVQDNYVVQWGDANYDNPESDGPPKALPEGLVETSEQDYVLPYTPDMFDKLWSTRGRRDAVQRLMPTTRANPDWTGFDDPYANGFAFVGAMPVAMDLTTKEMVVEQVDRNSGTIVKYKDHTSAPSVVWPVHCYGMVGVGRNYSPDAGTGAELYTVIGHAPRHLDRNIALVGRVVEGIEHLSSLPRGKGALGFYEDESKRTPLLTVRVASDLPESERPAFAYLDTAGETFARYADARANRHDPFFIVPAGGADICNIPVPVRRVAE